MHVFPYPIEGSLIQNESRSRFETHVKCFLNRVFEIDENKANCIAATVSTMYNRDDLYYHTHKHIMYILKNCNVNSITLEVWEELAILFHDVIYYPGKNNNEYLSSLFMKSLLYDLVDDKKLLELSMLGIESTAKFMKDDGVDEDFYRILDLDLMGLASEYTDYINTNKDIFWEFSSVVSKKDFLKGRLKFIRAMLDRKTIYRSEKFACLEAKARYNLHRELKYVLSRLPTT